ncbi:GntR family transcriptional regulator [Paludifilum halophilum]|uniref:GntR family transcriptional regulator n=1 Tax=Paludifilum halophilum TaxID=1642702 RepID=A0A235BBY4_9BACL|nr:GntR family transcriptional regulator [Paludifilum halophilum]OYD09800.1 GntR family transcriptional regulator [Paludifilum halophilum]
MPIPGQSPKLDRASVKSRVLSQLQQWIADGTLEPGEKIADTEVARAMGVSRTPIREALQILEIQGFIEMRPGKETRVTSLNPEDVYQLYPPLAALESMAAEIAADRIQDSQIEQLSELNQKFSRAIEQKDRETALAIDEDFHGLILEAADNTYILDFSSLLQLHIRRLKYVFFEQPLIPLRTSVEEHDALIEAFREGDRKKAEAVMRNNWLRPMDKVAEEIHRRLS